MKPTRFTILNSDSDNIYISKTLLNNLFQQSQNSKQDTDNTGVSDETPPVPTSPPSPPVPQDHPTDSSYYGSSIYPNLTESELFRSPVDEFNQTDNKSATFSFEPSIFMSGIRGEYERKFHLYQSFSQAKFDELNNLNKEMHKRCGELLSKEVAKVDELYFKKTSSYESPCVKQEEKIVECYRNNPKKPLLCSSEVKKFAECIEKARLNTLKANK